MEKIDPSKYIQNDETMTSYIDELVLKLKEDYPVYGELRQLNMTVKEVKENIGRLTDFRLDYNYCKNCPGIDKCDKTIPHIKMTIVRDGLLINSNYVPCDKIVEKIKIDNQYLYADFPDEWKQSSFATIDKNAKRATVLLRFNQIVSNESGVNPWIYVHGNSGTGKSFLLVTLANEYTIKNDSRVAVINVPNRFKELSDLSRTSKDDFTKAIVQLGSIPLLVLDDFGNEYKSEYVRDNITIPLLNQRLRNGLPTFISSQFDIDEIGDMYSIGDASGKIRGRQINKILTTACGEAFDLSGVRAYR